MDIKSIIESLLFVAGRPVSLKELALATDQHPEEIKKILSELIAEHENTGIVILEQNSSYLMTTNPAHSKTVKNFLNTELREKLTDASIETLAIIAYKQPISRAEIESIRGVNSQYSLRLLMLRGLIERTQSEKDARMALYRTTHEFLQHMGINNTKELPDFEELTAKVKPPDDVTLPQTASS
ncbi:MAG: SMC-Scp complex subunit ScpB [bacterium]|nr:SMC-Scp complex subunit ScpB [bacterium]